MLKTITHAVDLLWALADRPEQSVSELATRLELSRGSTHRILTTLASAGLLARNAGTGRYDLGPGLVQLGRLAERRNSFASRAAGCVQDLAHRTQETLMLLVPRGRDGLVVSGIESPQAMRCAVGVGDAVPLHAGAGSKAILAHLPQEEIATYLGGHLVSFTDGTIIEPRALRKDLEVIRKRGWSYSEEEVTLGTSAVGAPILDASGGVVGAISITAPLVRLHREVAGDLAAILTDATRMLSRDLGWTPASDQGAESA